MSSATENYVWTSSAEEKLEFKVGFTIESEGKDKKRHFVCGHTSIG